MGRGSPPEPSGETCMKIKLSYTEVRVSGKDAQGYIRGEPGLFWKIVLTRQSLHFIIIFK